MRSSFAKCDARVHDCVGLPPEVDNTLDTLPKVIMGELIFYAPIFLIPLFRSALAAPYTSLKVELWALGTRLTAYRTFDWETHRYVFLVLDFPHRS